MQRMMSSHQAEATSTCELDSARKYSDVSHQLPIPSIQTTSMPLAILKPKNYALTFNSDCDKFRIGFSWLSDTVVSDNHDLVRFSLNKSRNVDPVVVTFRLHFLPLGITCTVK